MSFQKVLLFISKTILFLAGLSFFGHLVKHTEQGDTWWGFERTLRNLYNLPDEFRQLFYQEDERLIEIDTLDHFNHLKSDLYYANGIYMDGDWNIELRNLKSGELKKHWSISQWDYNVGNRAFSHSEPLLPILLPDKSIICFLHETPNLIRMDSNSNELWKNDETNFHHAMNLDSAGNLWVCGRNKMQGYWDNSILKININNGKTLFTKSISDILKECKKEYLIYGVGNSDVNSGDDPFHLNDVEPALKTTFFWNEGDLFLSLRHRSMIVQYRPSTDSVIRIIRGQFYNQHDVDFLNDSCISIFNNNTTTFIENNEVRKHIGLNSSNICVYNLSTEKTEFPHKKIFVEGGLFTQSQGLHRFLSDGTLFFEIQNTGEVGVISNDSLIYYGVLNNKSKNGLYERTHWPRIYDSLPFQLNN